MPDIAPRPAATAAPFALDAPPPYAPRTRQLGATSTPANLALRRTPSLSSPVLGPDAAPAAAPRSQVLADVPSALTACPTTSPTTLVVTPPWSLKRKVLTAGAGAATLGLAGAGAYFLAMQLLHLLQVGVSVKVGTLILAIGMPIAVVIVVATVCVLLYKVDKKVRETRARKNYAASALPPPLPPRANAPTRNPTPR